MLGFIFGTVCLFGLIKVLRFGHRWAGGCGGYGYGSHGGGWRGFGGPRSWLRSILERLGTTPGQEKVIVSALNDLRDNRTAIREETRRTRADLAQAVSIGLIDDATLEETFARHDRQLAQLRVSFVETMKKITEALDERQRKELAEILEGGGWSSHGPRWGAPFHNVWA
jgi:Spy/CpxP family protein refolding chaperone